MKPNILILMVFYLLIQSCSSQMPIDPDSIDRIDFYAICRGVDFAQGVYSISELKTFERIFHQINESYNASL